jgi:DNA-binding NarL/FixJ family response regulator
VRKTTVIVADDHTLVRDGLVSLLREHDFDVVGSYGDGAELVEAAQRLRPDVIVADIAMPRLTGLEALRRLRALKLESRVVVLTMHKDAKLAARALQDGASGFLLKESAGDELVSAIQQALQGRVYLTPAITKDVLARVADTSQTSGVELTPRQREVLRLIVAGRRMKEIAAVLNLSTRTVETHKYELMTTLGLHSTAELVRYALEHRLLED